MNDRTTGQHILPRLLLTGFTASTKRRQEYTYLFRKGGSRGILSNVLDAAKRRLYYGEPGETGVEGEMQKDESRFAPAVYRTRRDGAVTDGDLNTLLELITNLSVRTHHLRSGMANAAARVFETVQDMFTGDQAAEIVYRLLKDDPRLLRGNIRKAIREIPHLPREPQVHLWLERAVERFLLDYLGDGKLPFAGNVQTLLAAVAETMDWEDLARKSHIRALQSGVSPQAKVEVYRSLEWTVIRMPERSLILGDFGPLGIASETGELRPLSVLGKEVRRILLPLSHDTVLLGYSADLPSLDPEDLRQRTACLCSEFFVAAQDKEQERHLISLIGTESTLLTEAEYQDLRRTTELEKEEPHDPPCDGKFSLTVGIDGTPACADKARDNLEVFVGYIQEVINGSGLAIDTKIRLLVTDDLRRTVRMVASQYGQAVDVLTEGRSVPVLGKNLYADNYPPFEGTIVLQADLWDHEEAYLVLARYQATASLVMSTILESGRRVRGSDRTLNRAATFQEELKCLAGDVLDAHDAQQMSLAFVTPFFTATDEKGDPASPLDRLAVAYVDPVTTLIRRLGEIVNDRVQPYREGRALLDEILPAVEPVLRELALLVARMIGMSSDQVIEWLPKELAGFPGFVEYLEEDWGDLVHALKEQDRDDASLIIVGVVQNVLARMGLYIDDMDDSHRDLLVGTPRFLPGTGQAVPSHGEPDKET